LSSWRMVIGDIMDCVAELSSPPIEI
jgi:hypothetical protein